MAKDLKIELQILEVFWLIDGEVLCTIIQIGDRIITNLVYETS